MGDFNPLCTQLYYVYFKLFNIWGNMGYYGSIWGRFSALPLSIISSICLSHPMHIFSSFRVHTPIQGESSIISFAVLLICLSKLYSTRIYLFIYLVSQYITHEVHELFLIYTLKCKSCIVQYFEFKG